MATQVKTGKGFGINDLLIPQHAENLLTSTASIPEPLKKGRDIGSLICLTPSITFTVPSQKKKKERKNPPKKEQSIPAPYFQIFT